ncbi:hypothetical protein C8K30_102567 [Promicromonospora sp. AC04]|uniref:DUF6230 family protein n=1 Tax=Promicromonospora sp. AC04 TaxID=2135723 RepID=UPI000D33F2A0|nr:DUF6230 family protein [Promicromonospora sp. AC04]PUB30185.1 hypothetical protein C8K30_102567 [Promicromonospora sp. AC04]
MKLSKITGSRKGRVALAVIPVTIAASVLLGGVAQGAVPVSFAISGSQFKIGADKLEGVGFSQYAGVATASDGTQHPAAIANIKDAKLYNLCQSVVQDTPLGKVGLLISAGTGEGKPALATDLQIGMNDLSGTAVFKNIRIGVDASTVNTAKKGDAGDFAMDSDTVDINGLQQVSWSTQAAVFQLTDLSLKITDGTECF